MASLYEELEKLKEAEAEAFEDAKNVEEPFERKIQDFEKRIKDLKMQRNAASRDAWNKHHVARTKTWEANEKIVRERYEESKKPKTV